MADLSTFSFFVTPEHECSYLNRSDAQTLFLDPKLPVTKTLHSELSAKGFRRSGSYLYRPHCQLCQACIPLRIPVQDFQPSRKHKRVLKSNNDLDIHWTSAEFNPQHYDLYERYISARHKDGDMYPPSREQYTSFLLNEWCETQFMVITHQNELMAVSVTDPLNHGLSAVYTFFNPDIEKRSLGVLAVLKQIERCKQLNLPFLYLGYWIKNCQKMAYKGQFRPVEAYLNDRWELLAAPPK